MTTPAPPDTPQRPVFWLKSVTWGYRDLFADIVAGLHADGALGPDRTAVTRTFYDMLSQADQSVYDHVLKEFLEALNPQNRWLLELPSIFEDVVTTGQLLAEKRIYYGIGYFRRLAEGGFGDTPAQVRDLMGYLRRLLEIDAEAAFAFLKGYRALLERLTPPEIELYLREGLRLLTTNRDHGLGFLAVETQSAESIILSLTRECRLTDMQAELVTLLRALTGQEIEVGDLTQLDADYLIERGTSVVCLHQWLYLPLRLRLFDSVKHNRSWYLLMALGAAAALREHTFSYLQGHPDFTRLENLVGQDVVRLNLYQVLEYTRIAAAIRRDWPGARRLLDFALAEEFSAAPPRSTADALLRDCLSGAADADPLLAPFCRLARKSANAFDTLARLDNPAVQAVAAAQPNLAGARLRCLHFLPDWFYPGEVSQPPQDSLVADLKEEAQRRADPEEDEEDQDASSQARTLQDEDGQSADGEEGGGVQAAFVYDEWCQAENDYYRDFCLVHELLPEPTPLAPAPELGDEARQIQRIFERLKPEVVRKERYLPDGDLINADLLLEYLVDRHHEPEPQVRFYEKPMVRNRDLATLILLDVSGSTGTDTGEAKVIDIEKRAAHLLAQGLHALGDRFALCGFSGQGREGCEYFIFKDFEDLWNDKTRRRLQAAFPSKSTRIGAALRHAGYRLSRVEATTRLILLFTDGKPQDTGYDPNTRYAQHDVRMACEENRRQSIHTFCISTEENSRADMEIMFPQGRFAILPDITHLPRVLPGLYIRMTV